MQPVTEQLGKFTQTAYQIVPYESYISLAERINKRAPLAAHLHTIKTASGDVITHMRTLGSMVAAEQAKLIQNFAMENGLLILTCGKHSNVIRFLYPLSIPVAQFRQGLKILKQGFATLNVNAAEHSA